MELTRYLKIYPASQSADCLILYATARGATVRVPRALLDDARAGRLSPEEENALARLGILVTDAAAEREELRTLFEQINRHKRPFTALVTLNLDCNLACTYCYEEHFRGKSFMTRETADTLIAHIEQARLANGMDVVLDFYGGEALLSLPMLRHIASAVGEKAKAAGQQFSFNLVTNGTLLSRELARELRDIGLQNVRFTIDGPPEIHNNQRPFVSGAGSFDGILNNMEQVCDMVTIQLGGNYTSENYRRFPELLDILLERGLTPDRLGTVMFSPVMPTAGNAGMRDFPIGCASPNEPWLIEASLFLRREILLRGYSTPKPKISACMVEFTNDLVINWDGSIYKCPAFMGWEDLCIGNLDEGVVNYRESHNLDVWKTDECLDCPYLPLCFGGCRFLRRLRCGAIDGVDCRKDYLDAALESILQQDLELRCRTKLDR
jgi:uncharacterized protein